MNKIITNKNLSYLLAAYILVSAYVFINRAQAEEIAEPCGDACEVIYDSQVVVEPVQDPYCYPSKNPEVNRLINKYFTDCKEARTIWAIAQSESGGKQIAVNKNNRNGSWDCGWIQANTVHKNKGESYQAFCNRMSDLQENIKMAKHVKDIQGWTAWVNYSNNCYEAFMHTPVLSESTCNK